MRLLGITLCRSGRRMLPYSDVLISVPKTLVAEIQEGHLAIYHTFCAMVEEAFYQTTGAKS
jgi:hypothetical protein